MVNEIETKRTVRRVGKNGQITLGKEHAGKVVIVQEGPEGTWQINTAIVIATQEYQQLQEDETS